MLDFLLAISILLLLFATALTQKSVKTQDEDNKQHRQHCQSNTPALLASVLLSLYGILGITIYSKYAFSTKSLSLTFWVIYILAAPLAYGFLPYCIKLHRGISSALCFISSLFQAFFLPFQRSINNIDDDPKIHSSEMENQLSEAVSSFDKLIVREIMIPKVDIFAIQEDTPIRNAFPAIVEEGYSRIPLYKKNIDNITGVLLVKDLLAMYPKSIDSSQPVSSVAKPPLYAPEIKKASSLLQEFRQKHRHLAIIVNEYGVTEGIVSMEDIIEEIFGEIADEYDVQEDIPYKKVGNSWIVDGRMNISDAEEYFNLKIHHENSYDTLGGHVFHKVGAVPQKGMKIHHENFDIEIITCSERSVGKLKITPRKKKLSPS
ncbi:hemolysin family protein [Chlamydia crocodili]|uniref:HlyC/CorC family transporter n=1 Tax=Chlamydia crocodili TaxID=2766982 RepID=A0ABX8CCR5_9CHLA|nr:hemolysin family protein [Chlamydia crocodili]QVE48786.1 HlyC/CorC family transporter [Chlamydia crocodili]